MSRKRKLLKRASASSVGRLALIVSLAALWQVAGVAASSAATPAATPGSPTVTAASSTTVSYTLTSGSQAQFGLTFEYLQFMAQSSGGQQTTLTKSDSTTVSDAVPIPDATFGTIQVGNVMEWVSANFQYLNDNCQITSQFSVSAALLPEIGRPGPGAKVMKALVLPFPQSRCIANCAYSQWREVA